MTTFLIIRHGQSMANLESVFAGSGYDSPLTDLGHRQAACTADYIADNFTVDAVYASPLQRAYDTGKAVADRFGLTVTREPGMREIDAGEWEGVTFAEVAARWPQEWDDWCHRISVGGCPGGERAADVFARVRGTLLRIAEKHDGETVVIASHATPTLGAQIAAMGISDAEIDRVPFVPNASVTTITCDKGRMALVTAGYAEHMGAMVTKLDNPILK